MAITHFGNKMLRGTKGDRVVDSLGSSADGTNNGITLSDGYIKQSIGSHTGNNGGNYYRAGSRALGSTLNTNWVFRFRYKPTALNSNSGNRDGDGMGIFITDRAYDDNTHDGSVGTTKAIGYAFRSKDGNTTWYYNAYAGTSSSSHSGVMHHSAGQTDFSDQATVDEEYYVEIIKNGTTVTVTQRSGSHSASATETETLTTSLSGFNHISIISFDGNGSTQPVIEAEIRDIELWDNATSASGTATWSGISDFTHGTGTTGNDYKLGSGSYSFDGSNDYVRIDDSSANLIQGRSSAWTIAGWLKRDGSTDKYFISQWGKNSSPDNRVFHIGIDSNGKLLYRQRTDGGQGASFTSNGAITDKTWTHFAIVWQPNGSNWQAQMYINGIADNSKTDFANDMRGGSIDEPVYLGKNGSDATAPSAGGDYFNGALDDLAVWHRALTTTEIEKLAHNNGHTNQTYRMNNEQFVKNNLKFTIPTGQRGGYTSSYGGHTLTWDLGQTLSSNFVARFEFTFDNHNLNSNFQAMHGMGLWLSDTADGNIEDAQNMVSLVGYYSQNGDGWMGTKCTTSAPEAPLTHSNSSITSHTATTYYCQLTKNGDNVTFTRTTNPDYTTSTSSDTRTGGNSVSGLRYLKLSATTEYRSGQFPNGTVDGQITNLKIDDNTTTWSSADITPTVDNPAQLVSSLTDKSNLKAYYSMDSTSKPLPTATMSEDFSSSSAWTLHSSSSISGGSLTCNNTGESYRSTGLGKPTNLTWDFTWTRNSGDAGDTSALLLTSHTGGYGDPSSGHTNVQFYMANGNVTTLSVRKNSGSGNVQTECHFGVGSSSVNIQPTGTTRYYRITKNGSVWTMKKFTSASDRTNDTNAEASATATQSSTADSTWDSGSGNLTYLLVDGHGSQAKNYTIDDVAVYEGTTEGCKNDYSSTSNLDAMTNLPENTIFFQTDDTPHYRWLQSGVWELDAKSATAFWSTANTSAIFANGATYSGNYSKTNGTMEWNGTAWSNGSNTNEASYFCGGIGNRSGAMVIGGTTADAGANSADNVSEKWDGSSWTSTNALNTSTSGSPMGGTISSGYSATTWGGGGATPTSATQSWDGTSWSASTNCATASRFGNGDGNSNTNFFIVGGTDSATDRSEIWNGSSWSAGVTFDGTGTQTGRGSAGAGSGSTNFIGFNDERTGSNFGYTFNGTAWTLIAQPSQQNGDSISVGGDSNKAITASSWNSGSSTYTNYSEYWNGSTWSTNGNLTASKAGGGMGASA